MAGTVVIACAIFAYLIPSFVAALRLHPSKFAIFALNLLFGWTVLGWIATLAWSLKYKFQPSTQVVEATHQALAPKDVHKGQTAVGLALIAAVAGVAGIALYFGLSATHVPHAPVAEPVADSRPGPLGS